MQESGFPAHRTVRVFPEGRSWVVGWIVRSELAFASLALVTLESLQVLSEPEKIL